MEYSLGRRDFLKAGASVGLVAGLGLSAVGQNEVTQEPKLRVGFVGVGGRGTHLLEEVLKMADVEVTTICDINSENLERAQNKVEEVGGIRPKGIGSGPYAYRDLITDDSLDCLVFATPCYWHSTMYLDAIRAGKHLYGEKPMSITAWELKQVEQAMQENPGVVFQIGCQWTAHQGRHGLIRQVQEGKIGTLLEGRFQRLNSWDTFAGWFTEREKSGDWMLEQAVHEFNLMWWVTQQNPIACYTAGRRNIIPGRDTTSYYTNLFRYAAPLENLIIRYTHTFIEVEGFGERGVKADFIGTEGAINVMEPHIKLRQPAEGTDGKIVSTAPEGDTPEHLRNFFDCVRTKNPQGVYCGIRNGIGQTILGLMIRQSLEAGREVSLEETLRDERRPPVPSA